MWGSKAIPVLVACSTERVCSAQLAQASEPRKPEAKHKAASSFHQGKSLILNCFPIILRVLQVLLNASAAPEKVQEINAHLRLLDNKWLSSAFLNLFLLPLVLQTEQAIIDIFREATAEEVLIIILTNTHITVLD